MHIETVPNRGARPAVLLREGWREGARVRKRTLANLSDFSPTRAATIAKTLLRRTWGLQRALRAYREAVQVPRPHGVPRSSPS